MATRFYPGWGLAWLRAMLGIIFFVHGWQKILGRWVPGFAEALVGLPATEALVWVVAVIELLGGMLLLVGLLTRWVAAILFVQMLVALFVVHAEHGFFVFQGRGEWGYEYHLALLGGLGCLVLAGAGHLATDGPGGRAGQELTTETTETTEASQRAPRRGEMLDE